jgi:hypothetical protein
MVILLAGCFSIKEGNKKKEAYGEAHKDNGDSFAVEPEYRAWEEL